jgi:hypothetical protein
MVLAFADERGINRKVAPDFSAFFLANWCGSFNCPSVKSFDMAERRRATVET